VPETQPAYSLSQVSVGLLREKAGVVRPGVNRRAGALVSRVRSLAFALLVGVLRPMAGTPNVTPDVVVLVDGTRVEGRVVFEDEDKIVVRVGTRDREIERAKVAEVQSMARSLREVLERWAAIGENDAAATLDLARFCKSRGLQGEAVVLAHRVLASAPDNQEAHTLSGHEKRGDGWVVRDGNKRLLFGKLGEVRKDWSDAWRFETTHFRLTTNLDLASACDLALELELFYRTFFDWFGADVELYEVVEPMACQVHADKASFPEAIGRTAYFDGEAKVLYVLAVDGLGLDTLIHEATHQLLHATAVATRAGRGEIPPWLHEGMAEYMSSCRTGRRGAARYDAGVRNALHFACHSRAKKPYDLSRILTLSSGDFAASSKADLKYSQAYTLVQFCLHGSGGAHRAGFTDFLRGVYRGKASSSDFQSAMKLKEREFEKAWSNYVKSIG